MKKIFMVVVLFASSAFATKARDAALGNHYNSNDPQAIYNNSMYVLSFKNMVSLETGITAASSTTNGAEGLVYFDKWAFSFGAINNTIQTPRKLMNSIIGAGTYESQQNPLHVWYGIDAGDTKWALMAEYSNKKDKVANTSETSNLVGIGFKMGDYGLRADFVPTNTVEAAAGKFEAGGTYKLIARYVKDDWNYGFDLTNTPLKSTTAGVEVESYNYQVALLRLVKKFTYDAGTIFTTTGLQMATVECKTKASAACTTKLTRTNLPFTLGVEAPANDWLIIRGSIAQNIYDSSKDDIGLPATATSGVGGANGAVSEFGAAANSTAVNMGVGLKFNNLSIDGTISTATTQVVNTSSLMSQVGVAYNF